MKKLSKKIRHSHEMWAIALTYGTVTFLSEVNAYAQSEKLESAFDSGTTELKAQAKKLMKFLEVLVGIGAIVTLAINFLKRKDGQEGSNETIVAWLKGLIFTFIGLVVVEKLFLR